MRRASVLIVGWLGGCASDVAPDGVDSDVTDSDREVTDTDSDVTETDREVTDTDSDLTDTDSEVTDTDSEVTESDSEVTDTDSDVTETDRGVTDTDSEVTDTDSGVTDTDSGVTETDTALTDTDSDASGVDSAVVDTLVVDTDVHPRIEPVSRGSTLPDPSGWPDPIGPAGVFTSGFGPRRLATEGDRDDFHLGFDWSAPEGEPLLAIADGVVHDARSPGTPDDGNTLYLEHPLPVPFTWRGVLIDRFYTVYSHLQGFAVADGDPVTQGQVVAYVGNTGVSHTPHLHLEIRLGTQCTLRWLTENPGSTCGLGFDPSINPFHLLAGSEPGGLTVEVTSTAPFTVRVTTPERDLDFNHVESDLGVLDFDLRDGIDATTWDGLDDFDHGWVIVDPDLRTASPDTQSWDLVFPTTPAFVEVLDFRGDGWRITP